MAMRSPERSTVNPGMEDIHRRDARTFTLLLVGQIARQDGRDGLCRVRNVSPGGLMAEAVMEIRPEDIVRVHLRNGQSRSGVVRWVKDSQFGMQFETPLEDVQGFLAEPARAPRVGDVPVVRSPRLRADCGATVLIDGHHYSATLTDLSQGGARLTTPAPVERDRLVTLSVRGLPTLRAVVRWAEEGAAGVSFLDHLSYSVLAHWLDDDELRFGRRP